MPHWVRYWICGKLAKLLLMENPKQKADEEKERDERESDRHSMERMMTSRQQREPTTDSLQSKSLLANVLDINDNFGVVNNNRTFYVNKTSQRRIKAKFLNDKQNELALQNYDQTSQKFKSSFKRDDSNMSEGEFEW